MQLNSHYNWTGLLSEKWARHGSVSTALNESACLEHWFLWNTAGGLPPTQRILSFSACVNIWIGGINTHKCVCICERVRVLWQGGALQLGLCREWVITAFYLRRKNLYASPVLCVCVCMCVNPHFRCKCISLCLEYESSNDDSKKGCFSRCKCIRASYQAFMGSLLICLTAFAQKDFLEGVCVCVCVSFRPHCRAELKANSLCLSLTGMSGSRSNEDI